MSSVIERGAAAAREIVENRMRRGPIDQTLATIMLTEAFALGALWGLERGQHALAITRAKYRTEFNDERGEPQGGAS